MSSVRVVRPRPLGLDERIPVYWSGEEAPLQIRAVDGGALWRYLQEAETQERSRKRQRGPKYKAPKEVGGPLPCPSVQPVAAGLAAASAARAHVYRFAARCPPPPHSLTPHPGGTLTTPSLPALRMHPSAGRRQQAQ